MGSDYLKLHYNLYIERVLLFGCHSMNNIFRSGVGPLFGNSANNTFPYPRPTINNLYIVVGVQSRQKHNHDHKVEDPTASVRVGGTMLAVDQPNLLDMWKKEDASC